MKAVFEFNKETSRYTYKGGRLHSGSTDKPIEIYWGGNIKPCCNEVILGNGSYFNFNFCSKTPKFDLVDGQPTKCGIHCAEAKTKRRKKANDKVNKTVSLWRLDDVIRNHNKKMIDIIQQIAEGHNNPRSICMDFIDEYNKLQQQKEELTKE